MAAAPVQNSLFDADYLLRELGQVAHVPQVALMELMANAWNAGASRVEPVLPVWSTSVWSYPNSGRRPPNAGGRAKTYFRLTAEGLRELREAQRGLNALAEGVPQLRDVKAL